MYLVARHSSEYSCKRTSRVRSAHEAHSSTNSSVERPGAAPPADMTWTRPSAGDLAAAIVLVAQFVQHQVGGESGQTKVRLCRCRPGRTGAARAAPPAAPALRVMRYYEYIVPGTWYELSSRLGSYGPTPAVSGYGRMSMCIV